jgi:hypothetical protein
MDVTDEVVRLLLESIRRIEPQTEQHVRKVLPWDIQRVHPHLLPPPSVAFRLKSRTSRHPLVAKPLIFHARRFSDCESGSLSL